MGEREGLYTVYTLTVLLYVGYLSVLLAVSYFAVRFLHKKIKSKTVTIAAIILIPTLLLFDIPFGNREFARLCDEMAGVKVHRAVPEVRAVRYDQSFCDSLCEALLERFDFLELDLPEGRSFHLPNSPVQPQPGHTRFTLLSEGSDTCRAPAGSVQATILWMPDETRCVAVEPISGFSARYLVDPHAWDSERTKYGHGIFATEHRILDTETGELLGEMNAYNRTGAFSWSRLSVLFHGPGQQFCATNPPITEDLWPAAMQLVDQVLVSPQAPSEMGDD